MNYYSCDQYAIHLLFVLPLFQYDGARLVPRIPALDLLRFAVVGMVLLGVAALHFVLRRGLVVVPMSGEPAGGAAWCRNTESPPRGAACRECPPVAPRCRRVASP